jgi:hypothetical protein
MNRLAEHSPSNIFEDEVHMTTMWKRVIRACLLAVVVAISMSSTDVAATDGRTLTCVTNCSCDGQDFGHPDVWYSRFDSSSNFLGWAHYDMVETTQPHGDACIDFVENAVDAITYAPCSQYSDTYETSANAVVRWDNEIIWSVTASKECCDSWQLNCPPEQPDPSPSPTPES